MELTLNIRDKKNEVIKTCKTKLWDLRTGTVKTLFSIIEVEKMMETCKCTDDYIGYIAGKVGASFEVMEGVLEDIFGVTREELENGTSISEVAEICAMIIIETVTRMSTIGENLKNLLRVELLENSAPTNTKK